MTRLFIVAIAALFHFQVAVAASFSPPPNYACGQSATACIKLAPRTNVLTWVPGLGADQSDSYNMTNTASGHMSMLAYEMPDDVTAVALIFGNGLTTAISVGEATVASSSTWGGGSTPGVSPTDYNGNFDALSWLFATFANNGQASSPWPGSTYAYNAASASGRISYSLNTSAASTTGASTLTFSSLLTSQETGFFTIQAGMYVYDGLGCIPNGTKISSIAGNVLTLSNNVLAGSGGSGCGSGQLIGFQWGPPGPTSVWVPPSLNAPVPQLAVSDWIPITSRSRLDNPVVGQAVTDPNNCIPASTTILAKTNMSVTISHPLTCDANGEKITATFSITTVADNPTASAILAFPTTVGVQPGQLISATGGYSRVVLGIEDATHVLVSGQTSQDYPAGTVFTLTNTFYVQPVSTPAGTTVITTAAPINSKPILMVRAFMGQATTWTHAYANSAQPLYEAINYSMPGRATYTGSANADALNFPGAGISATKYSNPVWGLMFLTKHNGIQCTMGGDSHLEGYQTGSGHAAGYARACYDMAIPGQIPTEVANAAHTGWTSQQYSPLTADMIQLTRPSILFYPVGTGNSTNAADMIGSTAALRQYAGTIGTQIVLQLDYPSITAFPFTNILASAVNGSTAATFLSAFPGTAGVTGAAVTCSPTTCPGATMTIAGQQWTGTFGSAQTLPAGTIVAFNVLSGTLNGTTAVTLAQPAPANCNCRVSGSNIPAGDMLTTTNGSTSATLSVAATGSGVSALTLSTTAYVAAQTQNTWNYYGVNSGGLQSTVTTIDINPAVTDYVTPVATPPGYKQGFSWDGIHADDYAWGLAEQQIILPALIQMRGN